MRFALLLALSFGASAPSAPAWQGWDPGVFDQAAAQHRLVLLDLEAVWCHWCHVMDETTYRDPAVVGLLRGHYLTVKIDQDSAPDLANRYGAWGWPATIILAADGTEIVKRRGYLSPALMADLLQAVVDDPSPGPSVVAEPAIEPAGPHLTDRQRLELRKQLQDAYDEAHGGWGEGHKLVQRAPLELELEAARGGDARAATRARQTLEAARLLIDPVWGGVYQYSDQVDWRSPHFEKIMAVQVDALLVFSQAYALWGQESHRLAARSVEGYLATFLTSPDGAFYASQDADLSAAVDGHQYYRSGDAERRKMGIPAVDRHLYARENGWAVAGLIAYHDATGDEDALRRALAAARVASGWELPDGTFPHGVGAGRLGDTVAMGSAFLGLYGATADRSWLQRAERNAAAIDHQFGDATGAGFVSGRAPENGRGVFAHPVRDLDENVAVARFANLLAQTTGRVTYRALAERALRYLSAPALLDGPGLFAGVLVADREISNPPLHVAVVGHREDPRAQLLFAAALALPSGYKRVDFWDPREGPLPDGAPAYPAEPAPEAYVCGPKSCSPPTATPQGLKLAVARFDRRP